MSTQTVAEHLSGALRCATVSDADADKVDWREFQKLHDYLEETYPAVHRVMEREKIAGYNLIFRWRGSDAKRRPIAFLSHQDVVPVNNESEWTHPPFSGHDDGEMIWGRGAIDMKQQMILILEACERLIEAGFTPEEDIYLCFGQNEEVGNLPPNTGADKLAAVLKERGVHFDCVIDEGGTIVSGKLLGLKQRLCMVGVAEKGFATFHLEAVGKGGHSARPPRHTALGVVCRAAARLEAKPQKPRLTKSVRTVFETVMPYMPSFPLRMMCANLWLFEGLFLKTLSRNSLLRAMISTTFAVTQACGSDQDNILPQAPWIGVNSRILPDEGVEDVKAYIERVINDDSVNVNVFKTHQVRSVSNVDTQAFATIRKLTDKYYPGTVTSPYIMFGGSDARNYYQVCDNVYRFMPIYLESDANDYGAHRANEHCPKAVLARGVVILMEFIKEYGGEAQ